MRLSQSEFAQAVRRAGEVLGEPNTCTKRLVQKWESGEHTDCRPNYRRALERATRTPYSRLGFTDAGATETAPLGVRALPAIESLPTGQAPQPITPGDRLLYALEKPAHADPDTIELFETATDRFFDLEHHQSARLLEPVIARHTDDIAALLVGVRRESVRRRLAQAGGRSAALAGWLAFERGDAREAHRWWDSALAAARTTGDAPLFACVLTYLSYSAAERGDPAAAWQLAHTAASHAGSDPRACSWMAARAAQEAAQLGDNRAALSELDRALKLGGELPPCTPDDGSAAWARFVDAAYIWGMAANVHSRMENAREAYGAATQAIAALAVGQTKARALTLAEAAYATADVGQTDFTMRYATEAADLAETLDATQAKRRLRALVPLLPRPMSAAARELATRVAID
jgi:tetratricopeptide (TPR) repeat protein